MILDKNGLAEFTTKMKTYIDNKFAPQSIDYTEITVNPGSNLNATLNIYKLDTTETNIYLDNVLQTTSTTSGSQDIPLTIPAGTHVVKIDGASKWYFDNYCLGSSSNNGFITNVQLADTTTVIGDYAFSGRTSLTSVIIPDSVISIRTYAFHDCRNLTSVTFGANSQLTSIDNYAFYVCINLTSITIPNSVRSIGIHAFYDCTSLTSIVIPNSVTSITGNPFRGCSGLTTIVVEPGNTVYDSRNNCNAIIETSTNTLMAGCQNTIIPNNITAIGIFAFSGCTGLSSITIPNSVTNIDNSAFSGCTGLSSITIPNTVTTIGESIFSECTNITSVTISNSITSISAFAFSQCTSLTSVTIPDSVTNIGSHAFYDCTSLTSITFGANSQLTSIGTSAFSGCTGLTSITIPSSVTSIDSNAFNNCTGLVLTRYMGTISQWVNISFNGDIGTYSTPITYSHNLYIGNSETSITNILASDLEGVTSIKRYVFCNLHTLTNVILPSSVTSIDDHAFLNCTGLTSITIPSSVTSIRTYAFAGCTNLTNVDLSSLSLTAIGEYAFRLGTAGGTAKKIILPNSLTKAKCSNYSLAVLGETVSTNYSGEACPVWYDGTSAEFTTNFTPNTATLIFGKTSGTSATSYGFVYCMGDQATVSIKFNIETTCFTKDCKLTLSDGTQKEVQDITQNDLIMAYNHDTGVLEPSQILFIEKEPENYIEVMNLTFDNGVTTKFVYEHGLFNVEENKYVYLHVDNCKDYIGKHFMTADKQSVKLINTEITQEYDTCYSLTTNNLNNVLDGMLSMPGGIDGIFNIFDYDSNLKYINEEDIKTIGLYTYETFMEDMAKEIGDISKYEEVVKLVFDYYPTKYFKIALAKRLLDWDRILYLINQYCSDEEHIEVIREGE